MFIQILKLYKYFLQWKWWEKEGRCRYPMPSMNCTIAGSQTMDHSHRSLLHYRLRHIHIHIYIYVAGNCRNQAFPEMPRHFWKCLEFPQLPRHLQKIHFKFNVQILGNCITSKNYTSLAVSGCGKMLGKVRLA